MTPTVIALLALLALVILAATADVLRYLALHQAGIPSLGTMLLMTNDRDEYRLNKAEEGIDDLKSTKADASDVADMVKLAAEDRKDLRIVIVDVATLRTKIGIYAALGSAAGTVLVTAVAGLAIKLSGA